MVSTTPTRVTEEKAGLQPASIGEYAVRSVQKSFNKSIKHKAGVLIDQDLEPIHQMRVGMRQLRTALKVFSLFVSFPASLSKDVAALSKALGRARDLDVLGLWFQTFTAETGLSTDEQVPLETIAQKLEKRRKKEFKRAVKALDGNQYSRFVAGMQQWLDRPIFLPQADWPPELVLPDVLSPQISQLLLHPGWLTTEGSFEPGELGTAADPISVNAAVDVYGATLHDLRKQIKRVRYQAEFFVDFYDAAYRKQISQLKSSQDLLGQLQDSYVLSNFLEREVGKHWANQLPSLHQHFRQQRLELRQQWQTLQKKYMNSAFRQQCRSFAEHSFPSQ